MTRVKVRTFGKVSFNGIFKVLISCNFQQKNHITFHMRTAPAITIDKIYLDEYFLFCHKNMLRVFNRCPLEKHFK